MLSCTRNGVWDKTYLSVHLCKRKYRKDKTKNNETGYLQRVGGNGVERMGEVKQETGKSGDQSDMALSVPFHKVLTFRTIVMFPKH